MKIDEHGVITPDEGMMLTNGKTFCSAVYLGVGSDAEEWTEVPMAEYEEWLEQFLPKEEPEAIASDEEITTEED